MTSRAHRLVALATLAAACGCAPGETGILVEVRTDLDVPMDIHYVTIEAWSASKSEPSSAEKPEMFDLQTGGTRATPPWRMGLRPADPANRTPVKIRATAFLRRSSDGMLEKIVEHVEEWEFLRGEVRLVKVVLLRSCVSVHCQEGTTCGTGGICVGTHPDAGPPPGQPDGAAGDGAAIPRDGATGGSGGAPGMGGSGGAPGMGGSGGAPGMGGSGGAPGMGGSGGAPGMGGSGGAPGMGGSGGMGGTVGMGGSGGTAGVGGSGGSPPPDGPPPPKMDTNPPPPVDAPPPPPDGPPPGLNNGQPCGSGTQCRSTFCVDSVCCESVCNGQCQACASSLTAGADGQCRPANSNSDPHNECTQEAACGQDGFCDGAGACQLYGPATTCGPPTCLDDHTFVPAPTCNGNRGCAPGGSRDCGLNACTTNGCLTGCQSDNDAQCASNAWCNGSTCTPQKALGQPCTRNRECAPPSLCGLLGLLKVCVSL